MLDLLIRTHQCRHCDATVRLIILTDESQVVIDAEPSPEGRIIPWPNERESGLTVGRVVDTLMSDEQGWSVHRCP